MVDTRRYTFEGEEPDIHAEAYVSGEATLVGDVRVGPEASVWPGAVLRGDIDPVEVGQQTHVGDNATIHAASLGERLMIGHSAVINDSTVGHGTLVGFNSTVDESVVGRDCVVGAGAVVQPDTTIPDESFVHGVPATAIPLDQTTIDVEGLFERYHSGEYADLAARHGELFE